MAVRIERNDLPGGVSFGIGVIDGDIGGIPSLEVEGDVCTFEGDTGVGGIGDELVENVLVLFDGEVLKARL